MITVLICGAIFLIFGIVSSFKTEFGTPIIFPILTFGFLIGLLISLILPNPTIEESRQLSENQYIVEEMPNGNKAYFIKVEDGFKEFEINEFIDDDVEEPYIIEYREKEVPTKWSLTRKEDEIWKYTYEYRY